MSGGPGADLASAIQAALTLQVEEHAASTELLAAMRHLLGRGKLYRPRLALATYESVTGLDPLTFVPLATPLEFIHTFTLIHDDLPCMDAAELRRGLPTVHRQFGEATAVLAGDALCALAFQVLATAPCAGVGGPARLRLIELLGTATQQLVGGQVLDLAAENQPLSEDALREMYAAKTGALLGASCAFGAVLAGLDAAAQETCWQIGSITGQAFQIQDDVLAATGSEAAIGKTLATDVERGKSTLVRLLGLDAAGKLAEQLLQQAVALVGQLPSAKPQTLRQTVLEAFHRAT